MFGNMFKGKAKEAINQFSGNKDFLEAMCAGCAWMAAASGGITDAEYEKTLKVIQSNSAISAGFSGSEIEMVFGKMTPKTATRSGKNELKDEIRQAVERDKTGKIGNAIMLAVLDVADEGGIDEAEDVVGREIAAICGVNYEKMKG